MKRLYFAHPINSYGTPLEQALLAVLAVAFSGYDIVNPADHEAVVQTMKAKDPKVNVMPYFLQLALSCDELVVLPFPDGKWGAGVFDEAGVFLDPSHGRLVWKISPHRPHHLDFVHQIDPAWKLSVEETRARVRFPDGTTRPYA